LNDLRDRLSELSELLIQAVDGPAWRGGGRQSYQFQVNGVLRTIDRVMDTATPTGVKPLRGITVSLSRLEGSPAIAIESLVPDRLGCVEGASLISLGIGGSANLATGDRAAARRVIAAATLQVTELRRRITIFRSQTLAPALQALSNARQQLGTLDPEATQVPQEPPAAAALPASTTSAAASSPRPVGPILAT
jgi:hypothetical protein